MVGFSAALDISAEEHLHLLTSSNLNHTSPLEILVLKNKFFGVHDRAQGPRVAKGIGNYSAIANFVVKRVMDMPVQPKVGLR